MGGCPPTPWEWGGVGGHEIVGASRMGKAVGWGRSLKWANWVHVNNFVSRWLDSGFEGPDRGFLFWTTPRVIPAAGG